MAFTALYDACVLYPAPLRDLLLQLALSDLFRAKWTHAIHDEWIRNVLRQRPDLKPEQLERTRTLMNAHVRDCLIEGYEPLITGLTLPDPDDRHVLAAAIHARADVIVTYNLKDFPSDALKPYGLEARHPDDFVAHLIDLDPETVSAAANACHRRLKNPPKTSQEYLTILSSQNLPRTVAFLRGVEEFAFDVWSLHPTHVYSLQGDDLVRHLMRQLRVPDLFASVASRGPLHAFVAFDNHPTHWIVLHLWQGAPEYSPNHLINKLVKNPDPNGLLFEATPKATTDQLTMTNKLADEAREMGVRDAFSFQQLPLA